MPFVQRKYHLYTVYMVNINMLSSRNKRLYLIALCAIWLVILLIASSFIYQFEIDSKETKLQNIHDKIYFHAADALKVYEVSIESFASMLAAKPNNDFEDARKFARHLRNHYPDIFMFEIAIRISHNERGDLEKYMQKLGYKDFVMHSFSYGSDRKNYPLPVKEFYYPIVFIEPELEHSKGVLGLDLSEGNSVLSKGLEKSFNLNTNVASRPFLLMEGIYGYVLYREVDTNDEYYYDSFTSRHDLYALLMVNAAKLLPDWVSSVKGVAVSITQSSGDTALNDNNEIVKYVDASFTEDSFWERRLLPEFSQTKVFKNKSQPFTLVTQYKVQWSDMDFTRITTYIIAAIISFPIAFWLSLRLYRNKIKSVYEHERNSYLANYDPLTNLPNKNLASELFNQFSRTTKRSNTKLIILYIDLDKFKQINDSYGHHIGDILIKKAAKRLKETLRDSDMLARLHGDEFVIFLNEIDDLSNVDTVIEHTKSAFKEPFDIDNHSIPISLSIGVSIFPDDATTFDDLLGASDKNMYADKKKDRPEDADSND